MPDALRIFFFPQGPGDRPDLETPGKEFDKASDPTSLALRVREGPFSPFSVQSESFLALFSLDPLEWIGFRSDEHQIG
ncbi:MAG: hypothetical protein ACYC9S_04505 [Leptospirales bacterium]